MAFQAEVEFQAGAIAGLCQSLPTGERLAHLEKLCRWLEEGAMPSNSVRDIEMLARRKLGLPFPASLRNELLEVAG